MPNFMQYTFELVNGKPGAVVAESLEEATVKAEETFGIPVETLIEVRQVWYADLHHITDGEVGEVVN